ncbi:MAG: 50S ribosomal protein L37ae [Candidatus Lokiarchaeota archaeon]|nr:50S ribosomal protein L37ae [Candidatus Lokiarchaeota archaeon]
MARTKKVGSTGRFGARYGSKLRRRVLDIERRRKEEHRCPSCATKALKRKAAGLWTCRKCGILFAGGAYVPYTDAGKAARRAIAQRVSDDLLSLKDTEDIEIGETTESEELPSFLPNLDEEEIVLEASDAYEDISDDYELPEDVEDEEIGDSESFD